MLNKCNGTELNTAQHLNVDRNEQQLQILIATGKLIQTTFCLSYQNAIFYKSVESLTWME